MFYQRLQGLFRENVPLSLAIFRIFRYTAFGMAIQWGEHI
jgi:hypothetical protein